MIVKMRVWIVLDAKGNLVNWKALSDGEEGLEVHRTRRLARGGRFKADKEAVSTAFVSWEVKDNHPLLFPDLNLTKVKPPRRKPTRKVEK